ncbi:hypothetical protein CVT24_001193 [Panaeolus cyanescens]|uniref:Uncharacterized protein n=1 Tax=Panaeolus cyanescens TaxID=181874 RepID=A0A409W6W0_9AGAR|nr:hypothetical protein CVT24_001193 [Panaeolus cyanescens]
MRRNIAQGQAVVVKLVVQESAWALALLFAMLAAIAPYASMKHRVSPFFVLSWSIALQTIMCCRLIMNMRRLKVEPSPQDTETDRYVLSTVILSSESNTEATDNASSPPEKLSKKSTSTETV